MSQNDFLLVASSGSPNVVDQATYAGSPPAAAGFVSGIVPSAQANKAWRQSSIMARMIAQFIIAQSGADAIDDGTTATLLANFLTSVQVAAAGGTRGAVATTGGATTLNAAQYSPMVIDVTGVLGSDATLTFPGTEREWIIHNATTGAHTVTCKCASGATVTVTQGKTVAIFFDGTNMVYPAYDTPTAAMGDSSSARASTAFVQQEISRIGGYYQDTGGVANAYIIMPVPPLTSYTTGTSFRIRTTRTGSGASTLDAGLGAKALILESGNPTSSGDIHGLFNVTYDSTIGAGSWVMNGEAVSELGACAKENIGQGLEDDGSSNLRVKLADSSLSRSGSGLAVNIGSGLSIDGGGHLIATQNAAFTTFNSINFGSF